MSACPLASARRPFASALIPCPLTSAMAAGGYSSPIGAMVTSSLHIPSYNVLSIELFSCCLRKSVCSKQVHLSLQKRLSLTKGMDNQQPGNRKYCGAPSNILTSSNHSPRETHKKYIEALAKMNTTTKPPTFLTFKGTISQLSEDHPLRSAKYIFEYVKKGIPHIQIVVDEEDAQPDSGK